MALTTKMYMRTSSSEQNSVKLSMDSLHTVGCHSIIEIDQEPSFSKTNHLFASHAMSNPCLLYDLMESPGEHPQCCKQV